MPLLKDFGNAKSSTREHPCTHAGDIGAPSAGNAGIVVIQCLLDKVPVRTEEIWKLVQRRTVSCIAGGGQWRADMAKTVAGQFAEDLAAAGVKRIHGVVGDSLNGLTDALRRQGKIESGTRRSRRCRGAPDG